MTNSCNFILSLTASELSLQMSSLSDLSKRIDDEVGSLDKIREEKQFAVSSPEKFSRSISNIRAIYQQFKEKIPSHYKKVLCWSALRYKDCRLGYKCRYAHTLRVLFAMNIDEYKTIVCQGRCRIKNECDFIHPNDLFPSKGTWKIFQYQDPANLIRYQQKVKPQVVTKEIDEKRKRVDGADTPPLSVSMTSESQASVQRQNSSSPIAMQTKNTQPAESLTAPPSPASAVTEQEHLAPTQKVSSSQIPPSEDYSLTYLSASQTYYLRRSMPLILQVSIPKEQTPIFPHEVNPRTPEEEQLWAIATSCFHFVYS